MNVHRLTTSRLAPLLVVALVIQLATTAATYWPIFGGDPEIHMIFAENLLHGHPLQFNPGEFTSGETSPLYMVIVAIAMWFLGSSTPVFMKLLGVASLFAIGWNFYRAAVQLGTRRGKAATYALAFTAIPFYLFQALLGMENIVFAAAVTYVVRRLLFDNASGFWYFFAAPVVLFLLRPEAVLLLAALLAVAVVERRSRDALYAIAAGVVCYGVVWGLERSTGAPLHGAGSIRAYTSRLDSFMWPIFGHDFYINKKPLVALVYSLPILALALWHWRDLSTRVKVVLIALFVAPLALHFLNVFPSTHFSRYFLYAYSVMFLIGGALLLPKATTVVAMSTMVYLLIGGIVERFYRSELGIFDFRQTMAEFNPGFRTRQSDELIAVLKPDKLPVTVALQEVQIRGRLDSRFVVRSLDGIVDYKLAEHIGKGGIDHFGYIRDRGIDALLELQNYNRDKQALSLMSLSSLFGNPIRLEGLCFERLQFHGAPIYKVVPCPP